jgi:hypothetical protein
LPVVGVQPEISTTRSPNKMPHGPKESHKSNLSYQLEFMFILAQ